MGFRRKVYVKSTIARYMHNLANWASGIRTREYSSQSAVPYHLAIALESFSHSAPLQKQEKELNVW